MIEVEDFDFLILCPVQFMFICSLTFLYCEKIRKILNLGFTYLFLYILYKNNNKLYSFCHAVSAVSGKDPLIEVFASSNPELRCLAMEGRFFDISLGSYVIVSFYMWKKQRWDM